MLRRSLLAAALLLPIASPRLAHAEVAPFQAVDFVRQSGAELAAVVSGAVNPADKQERLGRVVDQDGLARFCLGRYWNLATPQQQAEHVRTSRLVLRQSVVARLGNYQAASTKVTMGTTPITRPDGIYVPTIVERQGNSPVTVGWLVKVDGPAMHIADVTAEGISLRFTQRDDYASFLTRNGGSIDKLIAGRKTQVGE